jgi:hypothetical protein
MTKAQVKQALDQAAKKAEQARSKNNFTDQRLIEIQHIVRSLSIRQLTDSEISSDLLKVLVPMQRRTFDISMDLVTIEEVLKKMKSQV